MSETKTGKKLSFNDSGIINIPDNKVGLEMLDKMSRIKSERRIKPLDQFDNVIYPHRTMFNGFNLLIGDTYFMIPPEFIAVTSSATSQAITTLRQENTQKMKSGYHKRNIQINLVFSGLDQINGYKVEGPEGYYYVDGLRQLLAQFKCTPFLPISNELINGVYGIFTVALQAIEIRTVPGFPDVMEAILSLQEVNMFPYIEMPDIAYRYMIDWDLFRYYYQSFLTEDHVYKKLQSLPANKEHNHFKVSILDASAFDDEEATQYNMLQIICDKKIVKKKEDGTYDNTNYITWVDSSESDAVISSFECGYSNLLTNIQLSDISTPTVQFMGGMDTIYNIIFETTDYSVVQALEQCQVTNDMYVRNNMQLRSLGFVKLESELVEFTGSLFVMIENVITGTVPGFPGLYSVQITCVAYDIAQSNRESLNGFRPFKCDNSECINNDFSPTHDHRKDQTIEVSENGLKVKIKQDVYAEWKIRTSMEVYPDLRLPTYGEVNDYISKLRTFRTNKGLSQIPYSDYPVQPIGMLHGLNPYDNSISLRHEGNGVIIDPASIDSHKLTYDIYVDPDFYVFYPNSYVSFQQEAEEEGSDFYDYSPHQRDSKVTNKTVTYNPIYGNGMPNESLIDEFISYAQTYLGHSYVWGAEGEITDAKGKCFDCSGLVLYCLKGIGAISPNSARFTVATMITNPNFTEIPWDQKQRGDLLLSTDLKHVVIYEGNNKIIHASSSQGKVVEGNQYMQSGRCLRPNAFVTSASGNNQFNMNSTGDSTSSIVKRACEIIFSNEGNYASVNKNDNGAVSIGKVQWHGNRARDLLKTIISSASGMARSILGADLYNEIMSGKSWSKRIVTSSEASKISTLLETSEGRKAQDNLAYADVSSYIEKGKSLGLTDAAALIYFADGVNQYGTNSSLWKNIVSMALKNGGTLDAMYAATKQLTSSYMTRRTNVYNILKSGGVSPSDDSQSTSEYTLTKDEFNAICKAVVSETQGESSSAERAVAQVIYDRLTYGNKKFGGLSNILNGHEGFDTSYDGPLTDTVEQIVREVFCKDNKYWPHCKALYFLTPDDTNASYKDRDVKWDRLGNVDIHTFWGEESDGAHIKYEITDATGTSGASVNSYTEQQNISHAVQSVADVSKFGEPVVIKRSALDGPYADKSNCKKVLNSAENIFNSSFCDMYQYSARGRLVRAFPAYLFCILDDQSQWYDGRKLWTNYYVYKSVTDIAVHGTNDMPTETATITVTNSYHNLDRTQGGLSSYKVSNDSEYNWFQQTWYKWTGQLLGFGPKLTKKMVQLHQVIYNHALLREGARVHLRMGYGSDPLSLAPMINGHISEILLGDQIQMYVTSDGHELIQHIVSAKQQDTNNGILGLFGLGESQESSNIIADILCKRDSGFINYFIPSWGERSKYSIEHYGLIFSKGNGEIFGNQTQYDIVKNLYKSSYDRESYIYWDGIGIDGEKNFCFNKYNMTPWDIFQMCTQHVPEYIMKSTYHQFDSRLYFGLPFWMEKFRYSLINGTTYEECKTASQVHLLDSLTNIIDNQTRVTSRYSHTNVKVMYTRGSSVVSTQTIHSDDTIDFSKQKTKILDTSICQDALGPDALYELLGYSMGEDSARRMGITDLLYGWQKQYQGQIILMGCPGIKAHDYLMVNDTFSQLYGLCIAREVIHSFNTNTGFTTSITPGMIGFSTDENSGMIESCQNYLMVLNCFSSYLETRRLMKNNYEATISMFSDMEVMRLRHLTATMRTMYWNGVGNAWDVVGGIGDIALTGTAIWKTVKGIKDLYKAGKLASTFWDAFKVARTAGKGISAIIKGVQAGSIAVGTASGGLPGLIIAALWVVVDILLDELFEWLSNKNVCVLLPLWWQGYPFVSGVKDGDNILLAGNSDGVEEGDTNVEDN